MSDRIAESYIDSIIKNTIPILKSKNKNININEMDDEQKIRFFRLVNDIYMELMDSIRNNRLSKIKHTTRNEIEFSIYNNLDKEENVADYIFDVKQFQQIVVVTILTKIYNLDNSNFGGIFEKNDDYPLIIAQLYIYITEIPEMAKRITELSVDIGANGFETRQESNQTYLKPPKRDALPKKVEPPIPDGGWPSQKRGPLGGKTNRKSKYRSRSRSNSRSKSKSKSKKRRYKSRPRKK
jgi:hypothetical protein